MYFLIVVYFFCSFLPHMKLLNQFENTGPPPADKERIKSLPIISITEEHVGMWTLPSSLIITPMIDF